MKRTDVNNTGFVATGISLASLGIICFILTENQFAAAGGSSPIRSDDYHVSQLVKVGITGMVVVGFGLSIVSAVGITRKTLSTDS